MLTNFFQRWIQTHNSLSDFRYEKEWTRNEHGYYTNFFIKSRIHNSSEGKIDNTDEFEQLCT